MEQYNYYFTFGQVHETRGGFSLRNHWVRVRAEDSSVARCIFITLFAIPHLPRPRAWSMEYPEATFKRESFPGGEYMSFRQDSIRDQFYKEEKG